jgi:hypothetical protein
MATPSLQNPNSAMFGLPWSFQKRRAAPLAHLQRTALAMPEWRVGPGSIPSRTVAAARSNTWQTIRPCSCSMPTSTRPETKKAFVRIPRGADQTPKRGAVLFWTPCVVRLFKTLTATLIISHRASSIRHQAQSSPETPRSAQLQSQSPSPQRGAPSLCSCR